MITGLTFGQFSLIDLIQATLRVTGPVDVAISTWSAGFYDIDAAQNFRDNGMIRTIRFVLDSSQQKRGQATVYDVAEIFGRENVRTVRSHAKFATISNNDWQVAITSSMNLNLNQRMEQFQMVDDADTCGMFLAYVDDLFVSQEFGTKSYGTLALPGMRDVPACSVESTNWRKIDRGRFPKIGVFE